MCFIAKKINSRPSITKVPITCFKVLTGIKRLKSPYRSSQGWTKGKQVTVTDFQKMASFGCVYRGIHSFITLKEAQSICLRGRKVYLATIPIGSYVYTNETQYCSDKLIIEDINFLK